MPRVQESPEGRILRWFRTAPLSATMMLLALVKDAVRERQTHKPVAHAPAPAPAPKPKVSHKKKPVVASKPKSHHRAAPPAPPAPKKRVRHRRPRPSPLPEQDESFTSGELES